MKFDSVEANAIQNGIEREKKVLKESQKNIHGNVLFYWDSAKYDDSSKAVDRGFVDSISQASLRVTFDDITVKKRMLDMQDNPFHFLFFVDIEVMTVQNIPAIYKIVALNQIIPK